MSCLQAAIGIADLLCMAMEDEGTPIQEAKEKIRLVDSKGLVVKVRHQRLDADQRFHGYTWWFILLQDRKVGGLNQHKLRYAPVEEHVDNLTDVVKQFQPTAIIGEDREP